MRKQVKYAAIAAVVAVPLAAAVAVPASATGESGPGVSSAYGLSADGLIAIPRLPEVNSESHPSTKSVVSVPASPLVHLSVLRTHAVPGHADASVVDLKIVKAVISPDAVLSAKLISARCDDGAGSSRLVDVRLAGHAIQAAAAPNSRLTVPIAGLGGVQVTINKQVRNPDGSTTVASASRRATSSVSFARGYFTTFAARIAPMIASRVSGMPPMNVCVSRLLHSIWSTAGTTLTSLSSRYCSIASFVIVVLLRARNSPKRTRASACFSTSSVVRR